MKPKPLSLISKIKLFKFHRLKLHLILQQQKAKFLKKAFNLNHKIINLNNSNRLITQYKKIIIKNPKKLI